VDDELGVRFFRGVVVGAHVDSRRGRRDDADVGVAKPTRPARFARAPAGGGILRRGSLGLKPTQHLNIVNFRCFVFHLLLVQVHLPQYQKVEDEQNLGGETEHIWINTKA
jgi:hypothetical protein